jgi:hypothetical protein
MAELVNLRTARKRATRRKDEQDATASRLAHGQPKHIRKLRATEQEKADRTLDLHRIEPGDGR